jgi:hypothetical protein
MTKPKIRSSTMAEHTISPTVELVNLKQNTNNGRLTTENRSQILRYLILLIAGFNNSGLYLLTRIRITNMSRMDRKIMSSTPWVLRIELSLWYSMNFEGLNEYGLDAVNCGRNENKIILRFFRNC